MSVGGFPNVRRDPKRAFLQKLKRRLNVIGVAMLILGVLALVFPFYFTALAKVVVGWFFLLIGAVTLYNAIWARKLADGLLSGAVAALYLAVGVYLSFVASGGLVGLTAIVAVAFLIDGAIEYALAMRRKPRAGWNWIALSGLSSAMLGGVLLAFADRCRLGAGRSFGAELRYDRTVGPCDGARCAPSGRVSGGENHSNRTRLIPEDLLLQVGAR